MLGFVKYRPDSFPCLFPDFGLMPLARCETRLSRAPALTVTICRVSSAHYTSVEVKAEQLSGADQRAVIRAFGSASGGIGPTPAPPWRLSVSALFKGAKPYPELLLTSQPPTPCGQPGAGVGLPPQRVASNLAYG